MRFSIYSPPFPGFNVNSKGNVPASYFNLYLDNINVDWKVIANTHHMAKNSRIERFDISYNHDGTIKEGHYKIISSEENGFKHYWVQLLISRAMYLITFSEVEECFYYNNLVKVNDFFSLWAHLDLVRMKPIGNFEWYEFNFYGGKESYAIEDTKKYFIKGQDFISFGNDKLPINGNYISSCGMERVDGNTGDKFQGKGYQDYFFGVSES